MIAPAAAECGGTWDSRTYKAVEDGTSNVGGYAYTCWSASSRQNCVKLKASPYDGRAWDIWVCVDAQETHRHVCDIARYPNRYHWYAGPLYVSASHECIKLTGQVVRGGTVYNLRTGWIRCR